MTRSTETGSWSATEKVGEGFVYHSAMSEDGAAIVGAMRFEADRWTIWGRRITPDAQWSDAFTIASRAEPEVTFSFKLAINRAGRGMAVWAIGGGVFAAETSTNASIAELDRRTATGNSQPVVTPIEIGSDNYDRSIAIWTMSDGTRQNLHAKRYIRGNGWDETVELEKGSADVQTPRLVVHKQGNAMAVWAQSDGTTMAIWFNRYELGRGWSGAQRVEPPNTASNAQSPQIAMDGTGNVLAVWIDVGRVSASRYVVDRGWQPTVHVSLDGQTAQNPQLSVGPTGVGLVTWQDENKVHWYSCFE